MQIHHLNGLCTSVFGVAVLNSGEVDKVLHTCALGCNGTVELAVELCV